MLKYITSGFIHVKIVLLKLNQLSRDDMKIKQHITPVGHYRFTETRELMPIQAYVSLTIYT